MAYEAVFKGSSARGLLMGWIGFINMGQDGEMPANKGFYIGSRSLGRDGGSGKLSGISRFGARFGLDLIPTILVGFKGIVNMENYVRKGEHLGDWRI